MKIYLDDKEVLALSVLRHGNKKEKISVSITTTGAARLEVFSAPTAIIELSDGIEIPISCEGWLII